VNPDAPSLFGEHLSLEEHLEVVADRRLTPFEDIHQVARAHLTTRCSGDEAEEAETNGIREHLQHRGQLVGFELGERLGSRTVAASELHGTSLGGLQKDRPLSISADVNIFVEGY